MSAFVRILVELERGREEEGRVAAPRVDLTAPYLPGDVRVAGARQAIAAYRRLQPEPTAVEGGDPFPQLLSAARHSPRRLRDLRRRLAWRLHPDRVPSDPSGTCLRLAEVNAAIDDALARFSFIDPSR